MCVHWGGNRRLSKRPGAPGTLEEEESIMRKSIICTFCNHPPIRFYGDVEAEAEKLYVWQCCEVVFDADQRWGHWILYTYQCKSGKKIYFFSYNSGESYSGRDPETRRTFLRNKKEIEAYFRRHDQVEAWFKICGLINPSLIVDSDLL